MSFVDIPNLPSGPARLAVADGRITSAIEHSLEAAGICIIRTERHPGVHDTISYHPDIMLHHIGGDRIIYAPDTNVSMLDKLAEHGFKLIEGLKRLTRTYPGDISYNGARVGNFFFHNLLHTDKILIQELVSAGVELVNVKQGYAKCSIAVIDENSIITSDAGIAEAAKRRNISTLLIPPQKSICLAGLDYGFIGGSSGLINKKQWAVFGRADHLESFAEIKGFLEQRNCEIVSLSEGVVTDYGSLIPLKT